VRSASFPSSAPPNISSLLALSDACENPSLQPNPRNRHSDSAGRGVGFRGIRRLNGLRVIGQVHYDLFSPAAQREIFGQGLAARCGDALPSGSSPALRSAGGSQRNPRRGGETELNRNVSVIPCRSHAALRSAQSARDAPESPTILFVAGSFHPRGSTHGFRWRLALQRWIRG